MTAGMPQIGLELAAQRLKMLPIMAATHKRLGILGTLPLGRENGGGKMGRKRGQSKKRKSNKKNGSTTQNTRLQQLEAEISNLKDKIEENEKKSNNSANRTTPSQTKPLTKL
jgi:hypothetical protein